MTKYIRGHIMVKKEFAELILKGVKTSTIRLGKVVPKSKEIIIHSGGRPIAKAIIENVEYKRVKDLTNEDAKCDGYNSVEELLKSLEKLYNTKVKDTDIITIIRFKLVKKFTEVDLSDPYLGFEPIDIARLANRYLTNEMTDEERKIVDALLRYKTIRTATIKMFGTLAKRPIIRKVLRKLLARLIERSIVKVDEDKLKKLAELSPFWRNIYTKMLKQIQKDSSS